MSIERLNHILKSEQIPLKLRLASKYIYSRCKSAEVSVFFICKLMEHRLDRRYFDRYKFSPKDYVKKELELMKILENDVSFKVDFVDDIMRFTRILEGDVKFVLLRMKKGVSPKIKLEIREKFNKKIERADKFIIHNRKKIVFKKFNEIMEKIEKLHESELIGFFNYDDNENRSFEFFISLISDNDRRKIEKTIGLDLSDDKLIKEFHEFKTQ